MIYVDMSNNLLYYLILTFGEVNEKRRHELDR
jgi:hypothetical protein